MHINFMISQRIHQQPIFNRRIDCWYEKVFIAGTDLEWSSCDCSLVTVMFEEPHGIGLKMGFHDSHKHSDSQKDKIILK